MQPCRSHATLLSAVMNKRIEPTALEQIRAFMKAEKERWAMLVKAAGMVLFLWIFLATSIKRLHDRDRSAWWMVP